jgi:hypothetical protein
MKTSFRCSPLLALALALAQTSDTEIHPSRASGDFSRLESCTLLPIPETAVHHYQAGAPNIRVRESRGRQGEASRLSSSQNWSGYVVETSFASPQNRAVNSVVGRWTIPTVTASTSADTFSSIWVGIDGYSDSTVEQVGTEQDWTGSGQQNYVWFEMYPHGAFEIVGFPIAPNDQFGARVTYIGGSTFVLSITNFTQGVYYRVPTRYTKSRTAQRNSAEWVVEAPYSGAILPLADFGTVTMTACKATLNNHTGAIGDSSWQNDAITMVTTNGATKARPSVLSPDGASFSDTWYHE